MKPQRPHQPTTVIPVDPFAVRGLLAFPSRMRRRISMTGVLEGKVALVTGAGGGIGLATAKAFAEAGASVVVADRDEELIGKAAEGLRSAGHTTIGVTCDVGVSFANPCWFCCTNADGSVTVGDLNGQTV